LKTTDERHVSLVWLTPAKLRVQQTIQETDWKDSESLLFTRFVRVKGLTSNYHTSM